MDAQPVEVPPVVPYHKSEARPEIELKRLWRHSKGDVPFEMWLDYRDRARKDLFWLGKAILRKDLVGCHWHPCKKLFVQKNFDGVYHEGYTLGEVHAAIGRQEREKEMLWLDPRGAFKSTLDGIDAVQWMLNCPDLRILILTGEYKLALAFMSEIKGYFYQPEKADPTLLQQLFPEYIIHEMTDQPLECPARIHHQKEPSLWVNAIVANLSGWHCDIRKMDDVVTDENSNTVEAREKLKKKIDGTGNLVDEWGFTDQVGTRYFTDDYYGERLKTVSKENPLRYLARRCWALKPEYAGTALLDIRAEMVHLLFPEKLTFLSLRRKLLQNERLFRCQQLNEPSGENESVTFTEDALRKQLIAENAAPKDGDVFISWDWSFSRTSYADYSAGCVARLGRKPDGVPELYLVEVIFGRWKPSELAFHIVQLEKKWKPRNTLIEKSTGAELLQMEIARQAMRYGVELHIMWKKVSTAPDSKRNNIKGIETLISNDQLYFVSGPWIDETFQQLIRYTGERKNRGRKDDIPDAIGFLQFFIPSTENAKELAEIKKEQERKAEQQAEYSRIFDPMPVQFIRPQMPSIKQKLFGSLAR